MIQVQLKSISSDAGCPAPSYRPALKSGTIYPYQPCRLHAGLLLPSAADVLSVTDVEEFLFHSVPPQGRLEEGRYQLWLPSFVSFEVQLVVWCCLERLFMPFMRKLGFSWDVDVVFVCGYYMYDFHYEPVRLVLWLCRFSCFKEVSSIQQNGGVYDPSLHHITISSLFLL